MAKRKMIRGSAAKTAPRRLIWPVLICLGIMIPVPARAEADPLSVAVGARSLGMGGLSLSLLANPLAAAANPAGLSGLEDFTFSSMYGKLMNVTSYLILGLAYPTPAGDFAFSYLRSSLDEVYWPDSVGGGRRPDNLTLVAFVDSQYILTYSHTLDLDRWGRLAGGFNWKYLTKNVGAVQASGMEADLGAIYEPLDWLAVGLLAKNVLPGNMGGAYDWNGQKQGIPLALKAGVSARFFDDRLLAGIEADLKTPAGYYRLWRFGGEGWLWPFFCLRAGLDQTQTPTGRQNNLTLGLGLKLGDLTLDYAYHTYYNEPGWATHYISLTERLPTLTY